MDFDVIVLGAGAVGMMCAAVAGQYEWGQTQFIASSNWRLV